MRAVNVQREEAAYQDAYAVFVSEHGTNPQACDGCGDVFPLGFDGFVIAADGERRCPTCGDSTSQMNDRAVQRYLMAQGHVEEP